MKKLCFIFSTFCVFPQSCSHDYQIGYLEDFANFLEKEVPRMENNENSYSQKKTEKMAKLINESSSEEESFSIMQKKNFIRLENRIYPAVWNRLNGIKVAMFYDPDLFFSGATKKVGDEYYVLLNFGRVKYRVQNFYYFLKACHVSQLWLSVPRPEAVAYVTFLHEAEHVSGVISESISFVRSLEATNFKSSFSKQEANGLIAITLVINILAEVCKKASMTAETAEAYEAYLAEVYNEQARASYLAQFAWFEKSLAINYPLSVPILAKEETGQAKSVEIGRMIFSFGEGKFINFARYLRATAE